jgi:hypothetical protein
MFIQIKLPKLPTIYTNITGGMHLQGSTLTIVLLDTPSDNPERWQLVHCAEINMDDKPQLNCAAIDTRQFPIFWHGCSTEVRSIPLLLPAGYNYDDVLAHAEQKFKEIPNHETLQWELWSDDNDSDDSEYEIYVTAKQHVAMIREFLTFDMQNLLESWVPISCLPEHLQQAEILANRQQQNDKASCAVAQPALCAAIASVIYGVLNAESLY